MASTLLLGGSATSSLLGRFFLDAYLDDCSNFSEPGGGGIGDAAINQTGNREDGMKSTMTPPSVFPIGCNLSSVWESALRRHLEATGNITSGLHGSLGGEFGHGVGSGPGGSITSNDDIGGFLGGAGSSAAIFSDPTYYSVNYRIIGTIFQSLILVIGVLGNVMVVLVVKRSSSMQSPTNCYLVSLALADCVVLGSSVPNEILGYFLLCDEWVWGGAGCAIFVFLQYLGVNASALSITAFTVERYIAICHPIRAQTVCTVHRANRIIWGVWLFAVAYCAPWLALTKTEPLHYRGHEKKERCTFALDREQYLGYFFADLIVFYVVPLLLSCALYGLIARILVLGNHLRSNRLPSQASSDTQTALGGATSSSSSALNKANGYRNATCCDSKTTGRTARVQVVKMLVLVVVLFAVLWMPYRVVVVYNSLAHTKFMDPWFLMLSKTMVFMNSAINPILYNALSIKFRRAFRRMLLCGSSESQSSSYYESERGMVTVRFRSTCNNSHYSSPSTFGDGARGTGMKSSSLNAPHI